MNITIWSFLLLTIFICQVFASPVVVGSKRKSTTQSSSLVKTSRKSLLTDEERQFLRDVEAKFNIKTNKKKHYKKIDFKKLAKLPAVIAIQIVNDTALDSKGKRTIDANLGYGYQTDEGYAYNQLSGSTGKYLIYPYSQQEIPSHTKEENDRYLSRTVYTNKVTGDKTFVEIQPSRGFQLIPVDEDEGSNYNDVHNTISQVRNKYENIQAVENPPPPAYNQYSDVSNTLYTTYNGGHFSQLSGHFPRVMSNYYVDPSQIIGQPQYNYQQGGYVPQRKVIPVLILKIPSSQLQQPTAELYPNLPVEHLLNNEKLKILINQYLQSLYHTSDDNQQQQYYDDQDDQQYQYQHQQQQQHEDYRPIYDLQQYQEQPEAHEDGYDSTQSSYATHGAIPQVPARYHSTAPHTTFSQAYSHLANQDNHQQEQEQEEEEQLPISENYPGHQYTRVVVPPKHASYSYSTPSYSVSFVTPRPDQREGISVSHRGYPYQQTNDYENQEEEESTQTPKLYNYHAHQYQQHDKRQVADSNTRSRRRRP